MKKKPFTPFVEIFKSGCVIFTFIVFFFYILGNVISSEVKVLTLTNLFLLFLFSIWFAISNIFLKSKKMNIVFRVALHFISTVLGFFVIFVYLPGNTNNSSSAFVLTLGFAALYAVIAFFILLIRHQINKNKSDNSEYNSIYEKNKQDQ